MRLARSRIDHDLLQVRAREGLENQFEMALVAPISEALVNMVPMSHGAGQVAPRSSGGSEPKNGVDELALIAAMASFVRGYVRLDESPFLIGESVSISHFMIIAHHSQQPLSHLRFYAPPHEAAP